MLVASMLAVGVFSLYSSTEWDCCTASLLVLTLISVLEISALPSTLTVKFCPSKALFLAVKAVALSTVLLIMIEKSDEAASEPVLDTVEVYELPLVTVLTVASWDA